MTSSEPMSKRLLKSHRTIAEQCAICDQPATHKVEECAPWDVEEYMRHGLSAHLCCDHFRILMGHGASCPTNGAGL